MALDARAMPNGISNLKTEIRPNRRIATFVSISPYGDEANSMPVSKPLAPRYFLKAQENL